MIVIRQLARKSRHNEFIWRYGFNARSTFEFRLRGQSDFSPVQKRVVGDLRRDGIAVTSVDEILGESGIFAELEDAAAELLGSKKDELDHLRCAAGDSATVGDKRFNVEMLGSTINFDPRSIFARFALQEPFLAIANSYLGMTVKLRYYNVWYTFATPGKPRESQLWHFDREDNYILKMFLYLKDVDQGCGPFTYAPGTQRRGKLWGKQPGYHREGAVRRSSDEQMSRVLARDKWVTANGKKGTIVLADTRGFHKGGEARDGDRFMYTAMYTSPASDARRLISYSKVLLNDLSPAQVSALDLP